MGIGELLDSIRDFYLEKFASQIEELQGNLTIIVEPALLTKDGEYAIEGELGLPYRTDIITTQNGEVVDSLMVDTEEMLSFQGINFEWQDEFQVEMLPFQWNFCPCEMQNGPENPDWMNIKDWFFKWFEEHELDDPHFNGCLHYMSDPKMEGDRYKIDIDLGSAPVEAFEELLDAIAATGFSAMRIG